MQAVGKAGFSKLVVELRSCASPRGEAVGCTYVGQ